MAQPWKHLQGQVVGGKFPLVQYLGGSDHGAVFLTERPQGDPRKAVIKLVAAKPETAARQLSRWAEAEKMSHPHLLRLFEMGQSRMGEEELLYLVMEYAEEDLSQVLVSRALTPGECGDMLRPLLEALAYIHRQGFVHGRLKPSNILASQERVKLSTDGLCKPGEASSELGAASVYDPPETATEGLSAAGDVWSLGMTLVQVLTQKVPVLEAGRTGPVLPPSIPRVFVDVARRCLRLDPKQRWTVGEVAARVAPGPAALPAPSVAHFAAEDRGKKNYVMFAAVVLVLLAIFAGWKYTRPRQASPAAPAAAPPPVTTASAPPADTPAEPAPAKPAAPAVTRTPNAGLQGAVVREVLPKVPKSARDTIQGTVRVRIRVALDEAGKVASARFESAGPSKYFARLSMQAAQGWRFAPDAANEWLLRFEFRRSSTHVIPTPINP
ncbi:MAG TPA: TonB family protein [Terriglobales bacterium]|nr:TonB family protein [Terriglobales bacterium]